MKLRATLDDLPLQLELDDGNGFVHLCKQTERFLIELLVAHTRARLELRARVILVGLHSEGSQRKEVDAIAIFQRAQVGIAQREPYDVADACIIACRGPHP